jgi:hypothetical protein
LTHLFDEAQSKHVDPALRLVARGVGRAVLEEVRLRHPRKWADVAARELGGRVTAAEVEPRVLRDAHLSLKLLLVLWDDLFAPRLSERERAWAPEASEVRRLRARMTRGQRIRSGLTFAAAGGAGALLVLATFLALVNRDSARTLPSSLAGPWPGQWDDETVFAANLTQRVSFGMAAAAMRDDVLLLRTRLAVKPSWQHRALYSLTLAPRSESHAEAVVTFDPGGPAEASGRQVFVTMPPSLRLRLIPGSTRILDADGRAIGRLPDPTNHAEVRIDGLENGRIYYVESRLHAFRPPPGATGQIAAGEPVQCRGDNGQSAGPVTARGSKALCQVRLLNLGPGTLQRVLLRLSPGKTDEGMALATVTASAADSSPATTELSGVAMLPRGPVRVVEFAPRSARLLTAWHQPLGSFDANPLRESLDAGELRPGPANARYLEFAIRLR